jgi:hypothetical protein
MALVKINNVGAIGVIKDIPEYEIPPEGWTTGVNVRFIDGVAQKFKGQEDVYNYSMSGSITVSQSIQESPWFVMPVQTVNDYYWIYAGKNNVHVATSQKNTTNINKLDSTASATLLYSATPSIRWNGVQLAGLPVINNSIDSPQVWTPLSLTDRLVDMQWDISASAGSPTSWATRTAGAVTCKILTAYREFGIAMNTVEAGTERPRRLRWSHPAINGEQPVTWEETRTDKDASYHDFDDTPGHITDGKSLRDMFVVYKEDSTYLMQYIGGTFIHAFRPLFQNVSAMSHGCAVEFYGQHLVLTKARDVILHDGQQAKSILDNKWRRYLYNQIDENYVDNCFLVINSLNTEVWVCYPESGTTEAYWCTHALVWNWQTNTITIRELPKASHIDVGVILKAGLGEQTYATVADTYANTVLTYDLRNYQVAGEQLLMAYPSDTASTSSIAKLLKLESTEQFDGVKMNCTLERTGLPVAGIDRFGNPKVDLESIKYVRGVWPHFQADTGTVFNIYIGSQMHSDDAVTWSGPHQYIQGTDYKIDCRVTGRYIGFKLETNTTLSWKFTGYDLDIDKVGRF